MSGAAVYASMPPRTFRGVSPDALQFHALQQSTACKLHAATHCECHCGVPCTRPAPTPIVKWCEFFSILHLSYMRA